MAEPARLRLRSLLPEEVVTLATLVTVHASRGPASTGWGVSEAGRWRGDDGDEGDALGGPCETARGVARAFVPGRTAAPSTVQARAAGGS